MGSGAEAVAGRPVNVHYVGVSWSTGQEFDSSWSRSELFSFPLGAGHVIAGWDQGVAGMRVGGRRRLTIPPHLGYGERGRGRGHRPQRDAGLRRRSVRRRLSRGRTAAAGPPLSGTGPRPAGARSRRPPTPAGASAGSTPRTTAAGMPRSLPMTSSAAPASSSATQTSVASSTRPWASAVPRRSTTRGHAGHADGHVGHALAPGAPEGVGDRPPPPTPGAGARRRLADPPGRPVGVDGQQGGGPGVDVGQVHAGVGADEPVAGLGDEQIAAAAQDAHRLCSTSRTLGRRVVGVDGHQPPLGLGHHLLGDHQDVAVGRPPGTARCPAARRRGRRPAARPDRRRAAPRPCPVTGKTESGSAGPRSGVGRRPALRHGRHRGRSGPASAAAADGGHDGGGHHAAHALRPRPPPARSASASSMTRVPTHGAYHRATPTTDDSKPSSRSSRSAGPLRAAPATIGETPTTRSRRAAQPRRGRRARPGAGRSRPPGWTGRPRRRRRASMASSTPGAGPGRLGPVEADAGHGHVVVEAHEVLLEADLGPVGQLQPGAERVVGHRQQVDADAPRAGQLAGDLAQGGPLGQALGPVAVGGQVLVAEAEPGDPAQPLE